MIRNIIDMYRYADCKIASSRCTNIRKLIPTHLAMIDIKRFKPTILT